MGLFPLTVCCLSAHHADSTVTDGNGPADTATDVDADAIETGASRAAAWCEAAGIDVDVQPTAVVADGRVDLADYDLVWWHATDADRVVDAATDCRPVLGDFLAGGGSVLLTGLGLVAVEPLEIDPVGPTHVGREFVNEPAGLTPKSIFADHPAFAQLGDRIHTLSPGSYPVARYEGLLPERGHLLAAELRGETRRVGNAVAVAWNDVGAETDEENDEKPTAGTMGGHVYAIGSGISFADHVADEAAATRDRLLRNLLWTLGGDRRPSFTDRPRTASGWRDVRARLADDPHRPGYHLAAPAGWLNDPNGLIQHGGTYHVFYQFNPGGPYHDAIHWGHATSEDLLTWTDRPVALAPDPDGPDRDGCWSGCAVVDRDDTPTILYTGGRDRDQLPCLARASDDRLTAWNADPRNPCIASPPIDPALLETPDWAAEFRDHCVWRAHDTWYHLIGAGLADGGGAALLYRGDTLDEWAYIGPLLSGDHDTPETVWECPELLDFGDTQLLHISNYETVRYFLGQADLDAPDFAVDREGIVDYGCFYAPQSMETNDGRTLMWGWLKPERTVDAQWDAGWAGTLSIPREISVAADGRLRQRPARELTALRDRHVAFDDRLTDGAFHQLTLAGNRYELMLSVAAGDPDATLELGVFESPARSERTVIRIDSDEIVVDRSESSANAAADRTAHRLPIDDEHPLDVRLFIDGSTLELCVDEHRWLSCRVYPTRADADGVSLAAVGGGVDLSLSGWELRSTFPAGR